MEITEQMKEMAVSLVEELNGKSAGSSHAIEVGDDYVEFVRHAKLGVRVICSISLVIFRQMTEDVELRQLIVKNVLRVLKAGELNAILRRERTGQQGDPSAEG